MEPEKRMIIHSLFYYGSVIAGHITESKQLSCTASVSSKLYMLRVMGQKHNSLCNSFSSSLVPTSISGPPGSKFSPAPSKLLTVPLKHILYTAGKTATDYFYTVCLKSK
jgi:hypothetical protein